MKAVYKYVLMALTLGVALSCSPIDNSDSTIHENRQGWVVVVGNFPQFDQATNRAIGTQDEGKTRWVVGDELLISLTSEHYGLQTAIISYGEDGWSFEDVTFEYLENETPVATAIYAPCFEWADNHFTPKENKTVGEDEYIEGHCTVEGNTLSISFAGVSRNYSRLRIATLAHQTLTVTTNGFTPAGEQSHSANINYQLSADNLGNAYLYGTFAPDSNVTVESVGVVLAEFTFTADAFPNGTKEGKSYALRAIPQYPLSVYHYDSFTTAIEDVNNNCLGANAIANSRGACVAIYKENESYHLHLLEDISEVAVTIEKNCVLDMAEHTLTAKENQPLLQVGANCSIRGGKLEGRSNGIGSQGEPYVFIDVTSGAILTMEDIQANVVDSNGGTVSAVMVAEGSYAKISQSHLIVTSQTGLMSNCVYNYGECIIEQSRLEAFSNHCANAAGNNYGQTARALYSEASSTTTFLDSYIYGAHSGATIKGSLSIDGGTYCGYSHGGLYISNSGKSTHIINATIKECDLAEGFIDDGVAGTNHAGIYIGGSSNMAIYVDNCNFYGLQQPIVLRGSSGESNNILYISNSSINLDYTHYGVRNDGSNQIKIGINNNFGVDDLKYARNYELTEEEYSQPPLL